MCKVGSVEDEMDRLGVQCFTTFFVGEILGKRIHFP